jgi:hypothetical protein
MKRQTLSILLSAIVIGLVGMLIVRAQRGAPGADEPEQAVADSQVVTGYKVDANYSLSGPYSHKNLAIFLIHGQGRSKETSMLTLSEALEQKKVVVHETGDVNELAIENVSGEEVFVQSGDIVKGGQQDRVLAMDLIVPAKSGRVSIASFCVEQGRWNGRGDEAVAHFSSSNRILPSKDLKIAAKHRASQQEVWQNVAKSQEKMSAGVVELSAPATPPPAPSAPAPPPPAGGGNAVGIPADPIRGAGGNEAVAIDFSVTSGLSRSSLQLSLENKRLKETADEYVGKLSSIVEDKDDAIGYAFAINGQINSADIYSSRALFRKLWPKMLEASVAEAIGEFEKGKKYDQVSAERIKAFLTEIPDGHAESKEVTPRVTVMKRETGGTLYFETRDRNKSDGWIHRNYIAK